MPRSLIPYGYISQYVECQFIIQVEFASSCRSLFTSQKMYVTMYHWVTPDVENHLHHSDKYIFNCRSRIIPCSKWSLYFRQKFSGYLRFGSNYLTSAPFTNMDLITSQNGYVIISSIKRGMELLVNVSYINGADVEVWKWLIDFIPYFSGHVNSVHAEIKDFFKRDLWRQHSKCPTRYNKISRHCKCQKLLSWSLNQNSQLVFYAVSYPFPGLVHRVETVAYANAPRRDK